MIVDGPLLDFVEQISAYIDNLDPSADLQTQIAALVPKDDESEEEKELKKEQALQAIVAKSNVLGKAPEKEYEPACNLMVHLLTFGSSLQEPLSVLLSNLTNKDNVPQVPSGSLMVLSVLTNLFNILPERSPLRYNVFETILSFAQSTNNVHLLESQFSKLPTWLNEWGVAEAEKIRLYSLVSSTLKSVDAVASFKYLQNALESSENPDVGLVELYIATALNTENIYDFSEIVALPSVQTLLKGSPLLDLLTVVSNGDYSAYAQKYASSLPSQNLNSELIERKVKVLALAKNADEITSNSSSRSVTYADIAKSISVSVDEVEIWVIDAIRAGIIEGRLNQIEQRLDIHRISPVGEFGQDQWKQIQTKLALWDANLSNIVDGMRIARESAQKSAISVNN